MVVLEIEVPEAPRLNGVVLEGGHCHPHDIPRANAAVVDGDGPERPVGLQLRGDGGGVDPPVSGCQRTAVAVAEHVEDAGLLLGVERLGHNDVERDAAGELFAHQAPLPPGHFELEDVRQDFIRQTRHAACHFWPKVSLHFETNSSNLQRQWVVWCTDNLSLVTAGSCWRLAGNCWQSRGADPSVLNTPP